MNLLAMPPSPELAQKCLAAMEADCLTHDAAADALINLSQRFAGACPINPPNPQPAAFCIGDNKTHIHILHADGTTATLNGTRSETTKSVQNLTSRQVLHLTGMAAKALCCADTFGDALCEQSC